MEQKRNTEKSEVCLLLTVYMKVKIRINELEKNVLYTYELCSLRFTQILKL